MKKKTYQEASSSDSESADEEVVKIKKPSKNKNNQIEQQLQQQNILIHQQKYIDMRLQLSTVCDARQVGRVANA
jgi:hypothetical protein